MMNVIRKLKENQFFKRNYFLLLLLVFFVIAISVWYSPVLFKGYAANALPANLILARNLAEGGFYGMESNLGVVLAPEMAKQEASLSNLGNKLTPVIYGQIFKRFQQLTINELVFLSCFIYAAALIFFMLAARKMLGERIALFFGLVYILIPVQWVLPLSHFVSYEFATLFFSIFIFLYFDGLEKKGQRFYLIGAGIFLALAVMAKETFLLFVPIFLIYLLIIKKRKELLLLFVTFLILLGIFWLPNIFNNVYFGHLTTQTQETAMSNDFEMYGEFFADPYSYYFQKEKILAGVKIEKSFNPLKQLQAIKLLSNIGLRTPTIYERLCIGTFLFFKQNFKIMSLEQTGGPLVFVVLLIGLINLWRRDREKILFFVGWVLGMSFLLSFIVLGSRSHLMDIIFPLCLLIAVGINICLGVFEEKIISKKVLVFMQIIFLGLLIYNFIQTSHLALNRLYDNSVVLKIENYAQKIKEENMADHDVIAVGGTPEAFQLNYMTNKSLVIFRKETLEKLLMEKKLIDVFREYGVRYVLGYDMGLSKKISVETGAVVLAEDSISPEPRPSTLQKMFLNFFR